MIIPDGKALFTSNIATVAAYTFDAAAGQVSQGRQIVTSIVYLSPAMCVTLHTNETSYVNQYYSGNNHDVSSRHNIDSSSGIITMPSPPSLPQSGNSVPSVSIEVTDEYGGTTAYDHALPRVVVEPPEENWGRCGASSTAATGTRAGDRLSPVRAATMNKDGKDGKDGSRK
ncbi:hypothetical protein VTH06DRAFT_5428 [Thermothelomyces fergusii]